MKENFQAQFACQPYQIPWRHLIVTLIKIEGVLHDFNICFSGWQEVHLSGNGMPIRNYFEIQILIKKKIEQQAVASKSLLIDD